MNEAAVSEHKAVFPGYAEGGEVKKPNTQIEKQEKPIYKGPARKRNLNDALSISRRLATQ
jgi:hypothetical protein